MHAAEERGWIRRPHPALYSQRAVEGRRAKEVVCSSFSEKGLLSIVYKAWLLRRGSFPFLCATLPGYHEQPCPAGTPSPRAGRGCGGGSAPPPRLAVLRAGPFLGAGGGLGRDPRGGSGAAGPAGQRRLLPGGRASPWAAAPTPPPAAPLAAPFAEPGEAGPRREQSPGAADRGDRRPPGRGSAVSPGGAGPGPGRGGSSGSDTAGRGTGGGGGVAVAARRE